MRHDGGAGPRRRRRSLAADALPRGLPAGLRQRAQPQRPDVRVQHRLLLLARGVLRLGVAAEDEHRVVRDVAGHAEAGARVGVRERALLHLRPGQVREAHDVEVVEPARAARGLVEAPKEHEVVAPDGHAVPRARRRDGPPQAQVLPGVGLQVQPPEVAVVVELRRRRELAPEVVHGVAVDTRLVRAARRRRVRRLHPEPPDARGGAAVQHQLQAEELIVAARVDAVEVLAAEEHRLGVRHRRQAKVRARPRLRGLGDGDGGFGGLGGGELLQDGIDVFVLAGGLGRFLALLVGLLLRLGRGALLARLALLLVLLRLLAHG
mmetsp:Transcript_17502/g.53574  ORF Transcript_17502/g.53574 Transcript_17502/m.53574 type:complete len:321 (+) Transcript_17502:335-1297(+)